jgi:hypothetical protein
MAALFAVLQSDAPGSARVPRDSSSCKRTEEGHLEKRRITVRSANAFERNTQATRYIGFLDGSGYRQLGNWSPVGEKSITLILCRGRDPTSSRVVDGFALGGRSCLDIDGCFSGCCRLILQVRLKACFSQPHYVSYEHGMRTHR